MVFLFAKIVRRYMENIRTLFKERLNYLKMRDMQKKTLKNDTLKYAI